MLAVGCSDCNQTSSDSRLQESVCCVCTCFIVNKPQCHSETSSRIVNEATVLKFDHPTAVEINSHQMCINILFKEKLHQVYRLETGDLVTLWMDSGPHVVVHRQSSAQGRPLQAAARYCRYIFVLM